MGNSKIILISSEETQSQVLSQKYEYRLREVLKYSVLFCSVAGLLFLWKRSFFVFNETIDNGLLGTLGDFIGGVLGTFIALYTLVVLIRTLQNQIKTNENVIKTNETTIQTNKASISQMQYQIFDNKFTTLLNLYQDAINDYRKEDNYGKEAFDELVDDFKNGEFENNWFYNRRCKAAVRHYEPFYVSNRASMSVHLRMLYLLFRMLAYADINEETRIEYAKTIRGQLSENELFVIRYNCLCSYGEKMRDFANQFNLLKHLPIMSLLEFRKWTKMAETEDCINALDSLFIKLRKDIKELLIGQSDNLQNEISRKYRINIRKENQGKKLHLVIYICNTINQGVQKTAIEKALDKFNNEDIQSFFQDYFTELFLVSNFYNYNNINDLHYKRCVKYIDNVNTEIHFEITKEYPIILSQRQLRNP